MLQRKGNLPVKDMLIVSPAPRIVRPWSTVKNPYPYGCSVFCNHPKDPEQKEILWKSKPEPVFHSKRHDHQGEEDETSRRDFLESLRWRVQSRLEETNSVLNAYRDSRASSAVATRSSRSLAALFRRCVTPDAFPDNFRDRRRIVLDLRRRCRSSDGLSYTTAKTYDEDAYDVKLNATLGQPIYELTSAEIPQGAKHRTNTSLRKPRPRLGPQVSLEKEQTNHSIATLSRMVYHPNSPSTLAYSQVGSACLRSEFAQLAEMDLQVEGVKPKLVILSRTKNLSRRLKHSKTTENVEPKVSEPNIPPVEPLPKYCESDTESVLSESPLFRIEIAPKPPPEVSNDLQEEEQVPIKRELIPTTVQVNLEKYANHDSDSAFGAFLYKSYLTIAEVAVAKHRSATKQPNLLEPENNLYWSSEAPKPAQIAQLSELSRLTRQQKAKTHRRPRDSDSPLEIPLLQGFQFLSFARNWSSTTRKPRKKRSRMVQRKKETPSSPQKGKLDTFNHVKVQEGSGKRKKRKKKEKKVTFRVTSARRSASSQLRVSSRVSHSQPLFQKPAAKSALPAKSLVRAATIAHTTRPVPRSAPSEPSTRAQPSAKRRRNKKLSPQSSQERTLIEPKKKTVELVEDDFGISDVFCEEEPAVLPSPEPVNVLETLKNEDFLTSEGLKKLEQALRIARENVLENERNPAITQRDEAPMSFRALAVEEWLRIPRFGAVYGARFQLPINMRSLERMDTVQYLEEFVVLSRPRQRLIDLVFQRWQKNEVLPLVDLEAALMEITGAELLATQKNLLQSFLDLHALDSVPKSLFAGLAAVAERTTGRQETRKDDLEEADFSDLPSTLENLELTESLRNLLLFLYQT